MQKLLLNPGLLYLTKGCPTIQPIRWLYPTLKVCLLYDSTYTEIETALSTDWGEETLVIIIVTKKQALPPGYVLQIDRNNFCFITDLGSNLIDSSIVDNKTIVELDLKPSSKLWPDLTTYLESSTLDEFKLKQLQAEFKLNSTSLYHQSLGLEGYKTLSFSDSSKFFYQKWLNYLTDLADTKKYWIEMTRTDGFKLFPQGTASNFLIWLCGSSKKVSSQAALAPLIQPFVNAFQQTGKIEYIHDFARWVYATRSMGLKKSSSFINRSQLGIMSITTTTQRNCVYCYFPEKALVHWQLITSKIKNN